MGMAEQPQDLYFIFNPTTALIKIGVALDVKSRLDALSCANGVHLLLLSSLRSGGRFEKDLHLIFYAARTVGEWFIPTDELLALVDNPELVPRFVRERKADIERIRQALWDAKAPERDLREQERQYRLAEVREAKRQLAEKEQKRQEKRERREQRKRELEAERIETERIRALEEQRAWLERQSGALGGDVVARRKQVADWQQRRRNAAHNGTRPVEVAT
jgi:hypothetical protein